MVTLVDELLRSITLTTVVVLVTVFFCPSYCQTCAQSLQKDGKQYCYSLDYSFEKVNRETAGEICKSINSTLPTPTSPEEESVLRDLMKTFGQIYLALQFQGGTWRWQNGNQIDYQGCYAISNFSDFASVKTFFSDNGKTKCRQFCATKNYSFFSLFNLTQCGCRNSFVSNEVKTGSVCNMNCPSPNNQDICGGESAMNTWAVDGTESFWSAGQPNNDTGSQSCAVVSKSGLWEDVQCSSMNANLCQIEISNATKCTTSNLPECDRVRMMDSTRCLCLVDQLSNIFDARYKCAQIGGSVVQIDSANASIAVTEILNMGNNVNSQFWIGLKKWDWIRSDRNSLNYTNWAVGEPTDINGQCALMAKTGDAASSWITGDCGAKNNLICQKVTDIATTPAPPSTTRPFISRTSFTTKLDDVEVPGDSVNQQNKLIFTKEVIGAIVGGIVGFLIILVIIVILIICCCCCSSSGGKNKFKRNSTEPMTNGTTMDDPSKYDTVNVNPTYFFGIGTVNKPVAIPEEEDVADQLAASAVAKRPETKWVSVAVDTWRGAKEDARSKSLFSIDWSADADRKKNGGGNHVDVGSHGDVGGVGNRRDVDVESGGNGGSCEVMNANSALGLL